MSAVWKFELKPGEPLVTPGYALILHIGEQDGKLMLWAIVDPSAEPVERHLLCIGTGHDLPTEQRLYLGTAVGVAGGLVVHVFDEESPF